MQYRISFAACVAAATAVSAGPLISGRQFSNQTTAPFANRTSVAPTSPTTAPTDTDILNYALSLEQLENAFYLEGLANYTVEDFTAAGFGPSVRAGIERISSSESTHVAFLSSALGSNAVQPCTYRFPVTDVSAFVALANVLEGVGVSAYIGAAQYIASRAYLTDAASILAVEARHDAYIRGALMDPALPPVPSAFDTPLGLSEAFSLAAQFVVECPSSNPPLPVTQFPTLTVLTNGTVSAGSAVEVSTGGVALDAGGATVYAAFPTLTGFLFGGVSGSDAGYSVQVPGQLLSGQQYVILNRGNAGVTDETVLAIGVIQVA